VILPAMDEEPPVLVKRERMASESSTPHGKLQSQPPKEKCDEKL